jgi:hypothetical protein
MILSALAVLTVVQPAALGGEAITLGRKFQPKEKLTYAVAANVLAEQRSGSLQTWIPEEFDINYRFTTEVQAMKADGIVQMLYTRPTYTTIEGETFTAPPKTKVEKVNQTVQLTVSPINEILDYKDLTKKPGAKPAPKPKTKKSVYGPLRPAVLQMGFLSPFISEIHRLSLFVGSFDSALDFNPKLPLDEVKVGDTWKRTASFQPQKLKGKEGKQAVQRLDYTYTYKGLVQSEGRQVQRVEAKLNLSTDLALFFNQMAEAKPEDTGLKKIPLKLDATILFDLDPKTGHTLLAQAQSQGGFQVFTTDDEEQAVLEERLKGRTTMRLVGSGTAAVKAKK